MYFPIPKFSSALNQCLDILSIQHITSNCDSFTPRLNNVVSNLLRLDFGGISF